MRPAVLFALPLAPDKRIMTVAIMNTMLTDQTIRFRLKRE